MTDEATSASGGAVNTPDISSTPSPVEPAQTGAPTTPQDPAQTPGTPDADKQGEDRDKKPNRIDAKARVQQAVSRQRLAERERDAALRRVHELETNIRPENYDQLDFESRDNLRVREAVRQESAEAARSEAQRLESERREAWADVRDARNEAFIEKLQEAEASNPGVFDRFAAIPVTEDMAAFIGESDLSVEIANYLSMPANRRETERLIRLTDPRERPSRDDLREADRILSRIEGRLLKAPQVRKVTAAPNPGTTLNGGSAAPGGFDPATADDAAYSRRYKERQDAKRREGRS